MCIDFLLGAAEDGAIVSGRDLEFGHPLLSGGIVRGKNSKLHSYAPGFKRGLEWQTKYSYVGIDAFGGLLSSIPALQSLVTCIDGLNSEGLSCGSLWLPGATKYYETTPTDADKSLIVVQFTEWVLGMCKEVADVRHALESGVVKVWGNGFLQQQMPLHFPIHDRAGKSIVVEFTGSQDKPFNIYEDPVGVCTNFPEFPWHLTNISNFLGVESVNPPAMDFGGYKVEPPGQGLGTELVPGGHSPASRFIRALMFKHYASRPKNAAEARNLAVELLNTIYVIKGTAVSAHESDYTQVSSIRDATNLIYLVRTGDNQLIRGVDLKDVKIADGESRTFSLGLKEQFINITEAARNGKVIS